MSYYRRGYSWEQTHYIQAPTGGWNPDTNPWTLPPDQAATLDNFLIRDGKISVRGAFKNWKDVSAFSPLNLCGVQPQALNNDTLILGRKIVSATAYVDPWMAPVVRTPSAAAIADPSLTTLVVPRVGAITTNVVAAGSGVPGPRWINFDGSFYFISYGHEAALSPVQDLSNTFYAQSTSLAILGGSVATGAPHGPIDIRGYQSRIWLAGGIDTPGALTKFEPATIFFSNPIAGGGGVLAADWKDPVTGLSNKIRLDGNSSDPCIGLATGRGSLIVFRLNSIWSLRGTTTANYSVQPVSRESGCFDPRSIVETDTGVYFIGAKGLMFTDGVRVRNVSGTVIQTIQNAVNLVFNNIKTGFGGYATCARVSDGHIIVSLGVPSTTAGVPDGHNQPVWCGMFDTTTNTWVRITSQLFAGDGVITVAGNNYPGWTFNTWDGRLVVIGDKYVTQLEGPAVIAVAPAIPAAGGTPTYADGGNSNGGTKAWTTSSGAAPAMCYIGSNTTTTDPLVSSGYGFNLPAGAVVQGISASVTRSYNTSSGQIHDHGVFLRKAGVRVGSNRANVSIAWTSTPATVTFGSSSDLWGTSWSAADINNSGFGFDIDANGHSAGPPLIVTQMKVTVTYSVATAVGSQSFVQTCSLYDVDASGNFQPVPALWETKLAPLIGTTVRKYAQVKRFFLDYLFQGDTLPSTNGWTVQPESSTGAPVGSALVIPSRTNSVASGSVSGGLTVPSLQIQRADQSLANEADDLAFTVSWVDAQQSSSPQNALAEIYGLGVEFQPTRDLKAVN